MDPVDEAALRLAIELMRNEGGAERRQIDDMLKTRPWSEVGSFAALHCQTRALHLPPWQLPPCAIDDPKAELGAGAPGGDDLHGRRTAAQLLQRMLSLGVSRWHPDPMVAIAEAGKRAAA